MKSTFGYIGLMDMFLTYAGQMKDWRTAFDPELQLWIGDLEQLGCQFAWRATDGVTAVSEPPGRGAAWLELWRHGQLLDFAGPLPQPLTFTGLLAVQRLIEQQWHTRKGPQTIAEREARFDLGSHRLRW